MTADQSLANARAYTEQLSTSLEELIGAVEERCPGNRMVGNSRLARAVDAAKMALDLPETELPY